MCSRLTSSRFLPTWDSYLSTQAEHPPLFLSRSTSSSWSTFTVSSIDVSVEYIKKTINNQLFKLVILISKEDPESTLFSLTGKGVIIKQKEKKNSWKVPDSVVLSILLPMYNGIDVEVVVSQTQMDLLQDVREWLDPSLFDVQLVIVIVFGGYGRKIKRD